MKIQRKKKGRKRKMSEEPRAITREELIGGFESGKYRNGKVVTEKGGFVVSAESDEGRVLAGVDPLYLPQIDKYVQRQLSLNL